MHDPQYRLSIAWQNVAYNQPPHTSFYVGEGMNPPPVPPVADAKLVWRGGLTTNAWDAATTRNWLTNGLWVSDSTTTVFNPGDTVLFDLTGSNSLPVRLAGTLSPAKVTVNSPGDYLLNGPGSLAGTMGLVKAGAGTLTLNTTNTYSGETAVRDGVLLVNGSLLQSPVTVWGNGWGGGVVGGSGCLGRSLTLQAGGNLMPGKGTNLPGTLVISNSLTEVGGTVNHFLLSDDPSGTLKSNALVQVFGNVTLAGSNVIFIHPLSGALGPGSYTLFAYSGVLNGGLSNLSLAGLSGAWASLTNPPGRLALNVLSNSSASLRWLGGPGSYWDVAISSNWLNGSALARFNPGDSVRFDNAGSTNPLVNLVGGLTPSAVVVDASADYTFGGSGTIGSSCSLAKSSSGTLTILTTNGYTGPTLIGGGTLVAATLAGPGLSSSIGASGSDPTNLVFGGGTLRYTGGSVSVSRGATLNAGGGTIEVESATATLTLGGPALVGSGALTKIGSGTLALTSDSSFPGGIAVNAGTVSLGSLGSGGSGPLWLNGGTLYLAAAGGPAVYANALSVTATSAIVSSGTGNNNQALAGSWSGSATLYVNTGSGGTLSVKGDLTGFSGSLVLLGGGYFRFYGSSGSSAASFDLGVGTAIMHTRDGGTVSLGSLSGGTGTVLRGASSTANPGTFIVGANNGDAIFLGTIADGTKGAGATTAITKVGSGSWTLSGACTYTGPTVVSNGTLLVNAVLGGTNQVTVYGKLGGNGALAGPVTVQPGGILVPGPGLGLLTISNSLALMPGSATLVELSKAPVTNDAVRVTGSLALGGTLMLTNIGSTPLEAGDSFKLFSAPPSGSAFDTIMPATAGPGLRWDTGALAASGMLKVVAAPVPRFAGLAVSTNSVVIRGTGGENNGSCFVLTSTNVALSLSQWTRSATNHYDANGNFIFTNAVVPNAPQNFYILQLP
jgi:autotransporter-associated beta strand protein